MDMNKALRLCVPLAVLGGLVALFLPAESKESLGESWRRLTGNPGQICFDFRRKELKDPYSARLDGYTQDQTDKEVFNIYYHAKNDYGAYGAGEAFCVVRSGEVDKNATHFHATSLLLDREIERLKSRNSCRSKRNDPMLKEKTEEEIYKIVQCSIPD